MSAGRQYQAAAVAYKTGKLVAQSTSAFKKAVAQYLEDGKFSQAGKVMRELADNEEAAGQLSDAYASITSAIEYLETANEPVAASQMKSKAAQLALESGEFATAAELFEAVAAVQTLPSSTVEPYFKASLCHLIAGDTVATSQALQRFAGLSTEFMRSPEFIFVDEAINAIETVDHEAFVTALRKYETKGRVDPSKRRLIALIAVPPPEGGDDQLL